MSATPSPEPKAGWSWKRTLAVAFGGVLAIAAGRAGFAFLVAAILPAQPWEGSETFELQQDFANSATYEILVDAAKLTYRTDGASGRFDLYLLPADEAGNFFAGDPFQHVAGHASVNVEQASGSVVLPQGLYTIALACNAASGCVVPLQVELAPADPTGEPRLIMTHF